MRTQDDPFTMAECDDPCTTGHHIHHLCHPRFTRRTQVCVCVYYMAGWAILMGHRCSTWCACLLKWKKSSKWFFVTYLAIKNIYCVIYIAVQICSAYCVLLWHCYGHFNNWNRKIGDGFSFLHIIMVYCKMSVGISDTLTYCGLHS